MRDDCKKILNMMREAGYNHVCKPEDVDSWSDEEVEYFHVNFAPHYIRRK